MVNDNAIRGVHRLGSPRSRGYRGSFLDCGVVTSSLEVAMGEVVVHVNE